MMDAKKAVPHADVRHGNGRAHSGWFRLARWSVFVLRRISWGLQRHLHKTQATLHVPVTNSDEFKFSRDFIRGRGLSKFRGDNCKEVNSLHMSH